MLGEIDKDFYCAAGECNNEECNITGLKICFERTHCNLRRRKHPTPEQYKKEYGSDYPDDGAVYWRKSKSYYHCEDEWKIEQWDNLGGGIV